MLAPCQVRADCAGYDSLQRENLAGARASVTTSMLILGQTVRDIVVVALLGVLAALAAMAAMASVRRRQLARHFERDGTAKAGSFMQAGHLCSPIARMMGWATPSRDIRQSLASRP
jgi:hypothetical protein